jgi:hypothetical protein
MEQLKKQTYRPSRRQQLDLRASQEGKQGPAVEEVIPQENKNPKDGLTLN